MDSALPARLTNEESVIRCAREMGYRLVRIVVRNSARVDDPVSRLVNTARGHNVDAVIAPDLDHVGGDPAPICQVCDVVTVEPRQIYAQAHDRASAAR
ncbi:hypothetical protein [Nocardia thraciensis]